MQRGFQMADTYRVGWKGGLYKQANSGIAYSFNYQTREWVETRTASAVFEGGDGEDTYPSTEYEVDKLIKLSKNCPYLPSEHAVYVPMQGEFTVQIGKNYFLLSCYNRAFPTPGLLSSGSSTRRWPRSSIATMRNSTAAYSPSMTNPKCLGSITTT